MSFRRNWVIVSLISNVFFKSALVMIVANMSHNRIHLIFIIMRNINTTVSDVIFKKKEIQQEVRR